ncbi:MAG: sigma-70 family RNA polymerase sigma factor [Acidimicrobiia bacterium]|nr:sigma-70 family RNA polymerase sigma factor [Acidimicrobiia bacterium]
MSVGGAAAGTEVGLGRRLTAEDVERLFEDHHRHLVRLAGLLTGDGDQAQDLVADVFAALLRKPRVAMDDPRAYLRRCVVNRVASAGRRSLRRATIGARIDRPASSSASAEGPVAERDRVGRALMQLPGRQREVIVLRHFEDLSEAQTAALLGVPVGTVKSANARGVAALADLLREDPT